VVSTFSVVVATASSSSTWPLYASCSSTQSVSLLLGSVGFEVVVVVETLWRHHHSVSEAARHLSW